MNTSLTVKHDCEIAIEQLIDVYGLPKHANVDSLAERWLESLSSVPAQAVLTAVRVYIKTDEGYFPKPSTIRRMALQYVVSGAETLADRYAAWMRHGMADKPGGDHSPCPVCGAALEWKGKRYNVYHDHQRHYEAGVEYSGPRTGPAINGAMVSTQQLSMETHS